MKPKTFLIIGIAMFVFMFAFLFYAVNHPEQHFPWSSKVTYAIYKTYIAVMGLSFLLAIVLKLIGVLKK
jgi:hypothetical protein